MKLTQEQLAALIAQVFANLIAAGKDPAAISTEDILSELTIVPLLPATPWRVSAVRAKATRPASLLAAARARVTAVPCPLSLSARSSRL